jgi:transcriptional regulator with GAF, ATPase, and Fis domain
MTPSSSRNSEPYVQAIQALLLEMPQQRSTPALLQLVVERVADLSDVALARIWLIKPGDICPECSMRDECLDKTECLHLSASAGQPIHDVEADWSRIDGAFRRFPIGVRKVGRAAAVQQGIVVKDIQEDSTWIARPDWARREGIHGFGAQPLVFRDEVLGVLGVFTRAPATERWVAWLRVVTDHAATAIVNARSFEEIERLSEQLELENTYLKEEVSEALAFGAMVGASEALRKSQRQIELVAPTEATVLIQGESGTGKELVAREIHRRSSRATRPLIKVNCATIPRELYESEFFGHVKGAFTGAVKSRAGRFQAADGGTLFLDEVGEIPLSLQTKLLRVLQEGEYERVGDEQTRKVDVRIVAATNRDLTEEVKEGNFRSDLYYRLNVFPIDVPPLRERPEDIPPLASRFIGEVSLRLRMDEPRLTWANVLALQQYRWPGNVRELRNVIERAIITSQGGKLSFHLEDPVDQTRVEDEGSTAENQREILTDGELRHREEENMLTALERCGWKIHGAGGAAALLELKPTTLASRMKAMGIQRPH